MKVNCGIHEMRACLDEMSTWPVVCLSASGKIKRTTLVQSQPFHKHLLGFIDASVSESSCSVRSIHITIPMIGLSFTGEPGSMVVTWTTLNKTESVVEYGLMGGRLFDMSTKGGATLFVDSGEEKRKMYIHRVTLTGLKPAATYGGWSFDITLFFDILYHNSC